jgi:hypothetical protein
VFSQVAQPLGRILGGNTDYFAKNSALGVPRSNWVRRILSDGFQIRYYTMIGFDRYLPDVFRLFTLFSSDIRSSDLLNPDKIYVAGNSKIRSIRSVSIRCDSAASDVRKTSGYVVINETWFRDKTLSISSVGSDRIIQEWTSSSHRILSYLPTYIRPESFTCIYRIRPETPVTNWAWLIHWKITVHKWILNPFHQVSPSNIGFNGWHSNTLIDVSMYIVLNTDYPMPIVM